MDCSMKPIVCHGDSLTEGSDIDAAYRWPVLLQNALGVAVVNTGIGGDTTAGLLSRFNQDVVSRKPIAVILMGGTNDFWWDLPVNTVMANLYSMAYQARHHDIAPVFGLPLPFDAEAAQKQPFSPPEAGYDRLHSMLDRLAAKMKTAAEESEIPVLDFYGLFMDDRGRAKTDDLLEDGVHPNKPGHRKMAEMAAEQLKDWFFMR